MLMNQASTTKVYQIEHYWQLKKEPIAQEVKHVFKYALKETNPASLPNSLAELEVLDRQKVVTRELP